MVQGRFRICRTELMSGMAKVKPVPMPSIL
jgi:hypothetical protein